MSAIIQAAGWPVWFLILISIVTLAVIVERFWNLRTEKILPKNLLEDVKILEELTLDVSSSEDLAAAKALCREWAAQCGSAE